MSAAVEAARGGVGERPRRTDGRAKVTGAFAFSSDLHMDGMLFGATVRSPHPSARIVALDTAAARAVPGVRAVLTAADLPGARYVGAERPDQPVLADGVVRYHGEPVALVAADAPALARRAAALVDVTYDVLTPLTSAWDALAPGARQVHEGRPNDLRSVRIARGSADAPGDVVVRGTYTVGTQDQAFLGPESGLAVPTGDGGVELRVATQWLHVDRDQIAAGLGLAPDQVRVVLAGVGGAFGAREDLSMQLHACLLALRTDRPVKMSYLREESFVGHVHRHPAVMEYEHRATADGVLTYVGARLLLDGGAYASSSTAVIANATTCAAGPYAVPNALLEGTVAYTNNPPNGAMRGFGAVQVAIGYEAQMDRLAAACGLSPLEVRRRNALGPGGVLPYGQAVRGPVPVRELLDALDDLPLPGPEDAPPRTQFPTGPAGGAVRRGIGYAAGFKNVAFSEGFDDPATARVRLFCGADGEPVVEVHTAAAEVGQGVVGVQEQIARTELGVEDVRVLTADTQIASAGSASASRLSWLVGGAVQGACREVRAHLDAHGGVVPEEGLTAEFTYRHRPTVPLGDPTSPDVHAGFAFVAHRAVVDVDVELGVARVVELACAQDVGRAINPLALEGQLEGGSIQGLGLALSEELLVEGGVVRSRSFGEYRIPTAVDAAPVRCLILELGDDETPYGLKGAGELPSITSTPAILAALRDATGREVVRAPARLEDLVADERNDT